MQAIREPACADNRPEFRVITPEVRHVLDDDELQATYLSTSAGGDAKDYSLA